MSKVKIVATIGPATNTPEAVRELFDAGMSMARLNGAHADCEWHGATIDLLREVLPDLPILIDIPGRKIRTGHVVHEKTFEIGEHIILTTEEGHDGLEKVPVTYAGLHKDLAKGNVVLADDGTLRFTVIDVVDCDVICRAETSGTLKRAKGINLPGLALRTALLSDRDREMINFACEKMVDFVGISFVESEKHVESIRKLIDGRGPQIIAKVENQPAVDNLTEILEVSDGIMIDRGDLTAETGLEGMALMQKQIIAGAREFNKPVIVATEMMHTMIENPFPTKAEVSDVSNTVLDGASALMLSGETAIGGFAVQAVATMRRIANAVEEHSDRMSNQEKANNASNVPEGMREAIAMLCRSLPITKVVAITISGFAARMVAASMPQQEILAVSNSRLAARAFNLIRGTKGIYVDIPFSRESTDHIPACLQELWRQGELADDDLVLVTAVGYPRSGNRMNMIETHKVADLKDNLGWE